MNVDQFKSNQKQNKSDSLSEEQGINRTGIKYKYSGIKIAVIIPAYNEEMNIKNTILRIPNDISDKLDIVVIDDGSIDKTGEIAQDFNAFVIKHDRNKGNGAAVKTGLEFAKKNHYDMAVILDADGQHEPKHLSRFIDPIIKEGIDFVIGNRYKHPYEMHIIKKIFSRIMSNLYSFLLKTKVSDPTMGFRALSSNVFNNINFETNYSVCQEMLLKVIPNYSFKEVATKVYQRKYGESFVKLTKFFKKSMTALFKFYFFPKFLKKYRHKFRKLIKLYLYLRKKSLLSLILHSRK